MLYKCTGKEGRVDDEGKHESEYERVNEGISNNEGLARMTTVHTG